MVSLGALRGKPSIGTFVGSDRSAAQELLSQFAPRKQHQLQGQQGLDIFWLRSILNAFCCEKYKFGRSCGPTGQRFIQPSPFGLGHRYPMMVGEAQRAGHSSWSRNVSIIGSCVAARGLQYEGPPSLPSARRTSRREVSHAWVSRQRDRLPCVESRCVDRPCPCRLRALADCHNCGAR